MAIAIGDFKENLVAIVYKGLSVKKHLIVGARSRVPLPV
jgi:hypothetical protein